MSDSNRGRDRSYWLTVCTVLLGVILSVLCAGLVRQAKLSYDNARQYDRTTDPESSYRICLKIPPVIDFCPKQQGDRRAEKQRGDDDLAAQQEMADWAFIAALTSVAGFWMSAVGLFLIYATLRKTSEAVEVTNQQLVIENRPWIRIEPREASDMTFDEKGGYISFQVIYNNIGNSPALRLSLSCGEFNFYADDIVGEIDRFKRKVKADFIASEKRGETVFPNETSRANGSARVRLETIDKSIIDPKRPNVRLFFASFIFSVLYQSAIDDTIFQTTIVMNLDEDEPSGMMKSIPIDDKEIPDPIPFMQMRLSVYPGTYEAS